MYVKEVTTDGPALRGIVKLEEEEECSDNSEEDFECMKALRCLICVRSHFIRED
jgi:hypothetical protein